MSTDDLFRTRLDSMIDLRHPLAVLSTRMPWDLIECALAPVRAHKDRAGRTVEGADLFGPSVVVAGAGVSAAGRPRLPVRLMVSLLYLKHAFNESDESIVERWSENVYWQFFSGMTFYEPKLPCDPAQISRFLRALGEAGVERLLKTTIEAAVAMNAAKPKDFEREGKTLRRRAGGYAHAKQFKRLRKVVKRQRTVLSIVLREVRRKMTEVPTEIAQAMEVWLQRAELIHAQQRHDKNKLYALHAPEVECIGKGKARKPYEFGVKASIAVSHAKGLIVGARSFPGNPYDGYTLAEQLEQTRNLLQALGVKPVTAVVDLGFRGVDEDIAQVQSIHRGKFKTLTTQQRRWLKRRQAVEPTIGHLKQDHRMDRCWLKGTEGDALHTVLCAAGFNIRWLMRAIARLGLAAALFCLHRMVAWVHVLGIASRHAADHASARVSSMRSALSFGYCAAVG